MLPRSERSALRFAVFAAGALLMALEVAAFRIIGKTFGSALRETTTVIAVFLAAMAVGYWGGGRAADRRPRSSTLVATLLAAAATVLLVPWADAALSPLVAASGLALATHAFVATTILFAVPTVLLAATSPIAIRLFTTTTGESGSTAGGISALSTTGSIAGSLITAFFLIDWLESISRTVIFVALGTGATALLVFIASAHRSSASRRTRALAAAGGALLLVLLVAAFVRSSTVENELTAPLPGSTIVYVADSPYHRVTVRDRGPYRDLYFNVARQTSMKRSDPHGAGLPYTVLFHIAPLLRPDIQRVLMIGLGGGTGVKQFARMYPNVQLDVVEVDPMVAEVARRFFSVQPNERLRIHVGDGRTFLKRSSEKWDLIIVDAYTTNRYGDTMPPHLTTREFFAEIAERLTEDGVLHFHCAFSSSPLLPAIQRTIADVYPHVLRTSGEILASPLSMVFDRDQLAARANASPAAGLPDLHRGVAELTAERLPAANAPLLTDDYAPVDTLIYGKR
ncbi:MAG TPA: fused MFS/spermidine synthase [Thermoanaerobaculia bacterium]|nr:fused MFS/spermidine synthase [Thermoanaerobaculia bacterium]